MYENIAIIGAGMAGATAARLLADAGHSVVVFEKSGGTGGRLSTRRTEYGDFDHGAQYVSTKGAAFSSMMTDFVAQGAVADWSPIGKDREGNWHVGTPGMSGLVKPLLAGIDVRTKTRIQSIERQGDEYGCIDERGHSTPFNRVIVAIPSPQASALLVPLDEAFKALDEVVYMPCWASMFSFENPIDTLPNLYRGDDSMTISWLARNNTKPKRSDGESIVAQAGSLWSRDNLEIEPDEALNRMLLALEDMAGRVLRPNFAQAHRWRYARVDRPFGKPFLTNEEASLCAIGDGMLGGRVEAAFESSRKLCEYLLARQ